MGGMVIRIDCPWSAGAGCHESENGLADVNHVVRNDVLGDPATMADQVAAILAERFGVIEAG